MLSYCAAFEKLKALAEGDIFSSSTMSGLCCSPHFHLSDMCVCLSESVDQSQKLAKAQGGEMPFKRDKNALDI